MSSASSEPFPSTSAQPGAQPGAHPRLSTFLKALNSMLSDEMRQGGPSSSGLPPGLSPGSSDGSDLTEKERSALERKHRRIRGAIPRFPGKGVCGYISKLTEPDASYLYTETFGYCPLIKLDAVENLSLTYTKAYMQTIANITRLMPDFHQSSVKQIVKNYENASAYIEDVLKQISERTAQITPFWKKSEHTLFAFRFPLVREYDALLNGDETTAEISESDYYKHMGSTRLVIDGTEVFNTTINSEYWKSRPVPLNFPICLAPTKTLKFSHLALTDSSIALTSFNKDMEYSRVIPILGVRKDIIPET